MGFTTGFGTIAPGQVQYWWYRHFQGGVDGVDLGPQYAMANPLNPGGFLRVYHQSKKKEDNGSITYWVTVENVGSVTTNFNLQGGGLT
jgi:hypothetical protein